MEGINLKAMDGKIPSQNLIKQFNVNATSRQPGFYKGIVFDALTVLAALGLGYVYKQYLAGGFDIWMLLAAVLVYATLGTLQVFLNKSIGRRFLVLLLEAGAVLGPFYQYDFRVLLSAAAVILVFFIWGDVSGKWQLENGLEVRFFKSALPFLKKFTTAVVFVLLILYIPQADQGRLFVSQQNFQAFFDWASGFANKFYPGVILNSSFGKFAESLARLELTGNQNFQNLPPANQEAAVKAAADQLSAALGKNLGIAVSPEAPASSVFYNFIVSELVSSREKFQNWFFVVWVLSAFLIIRGFGIFFYWIAALFAFIFYQILLASGFIHILGESRTHEVIVY